MNLFTQHSDEEYELLERAFWNQQDKNFNQELEIEFLKEKYHTSSRIFKNFSTGLVNALEDTILERDSYQGNYELERGVNDCLVSEIIKLEEVVKNQKTIIGSYEILAKDKKKGGKSK